jgi:hypothetical protein
VRARHGHPAAAGGGPAGGGRAPEALENYAGRLIDYGVILPKMQALYEFAASDLDEPQLLDLVRNGFPVYAWPYEDRNAWTTTRARSVRSVLSWLTSA